MQKDNDNNGDFSELKSEMSRLESVRGLDNWASVRTRDNFEPIERQYGFGTRVCYQRIESKDSRYVDLQASRGLSFFEDATGDLDAAAAWSREGSLNSGDKLRIYEIDKVWECLKSEGREVNHSGVAELGFRFPKLLKHYKEKYGVPVRGYDVVPINVEVGRRLGFDTRRYDFDLCSEDLDLSGVSLVVSYHMFEHLSDPLKALKKVYDAMETDAYFHIEVPIEPGIPRVELGHMFAFEKNDLWYMLDKCGFDVLTSSDSSHDNGLLIERYMVQKPSKEINFFSLGE